MLERVFNMRFDKIYALYLAKVERKGRDKDELDTVIFWLTGHNKNSLLTQLQGASVVEFFDSFPALNPNASLIKGSICGIKVEEITDPIMQKIRYLDKLVDELSKGKPLEKILRK